MSSFGGETPVNVTSIDSFTTSGTYYTVPAGRYAKINMLVKFAYAGTGGRATVSVGGVALASESTTDGDGYTPEQWILTAGETIQYTVGGGSSLTHVHIKIIEFNNPS